MGPLNIHTLTIMLWTLGVVVIGLVALGSPLLAIYLLIRSRRGRAPLELVVILFLSAWLSAVAYRHGANLKEDIRNQHRGHA
jgi:hypothetical protein